MPATLRTLLPVAMLAVALSWPGPAASRPRSDGRTRGPAAPSLIAPGELGDGSLGSELVAAARRIVGFRGSFDARRFLAHVLRTAGVRPLTPVDPGALVRSLRDKGLSRTRRVRPGDLVFFRLAPDSVLPGVALDGARQRFRFAAPVGDSVIVGTASPAATARNRRHDTPLVECRTVQEPVKAPPRRGSRTGTRQKAAVRERALPCRAGDLFLGSSAPASAERALLPRLADHGVHGSVDASRPRGRTERAARRGER